MARIFTIDFEFQGRHHAALAATWKGQAQSDCFRISLQDEALQALVPGGVICFSTGDGDVLHNSTGPEELVQCIKNAVVCHLQAASAQNNTVLL
jgi:hypothetical protein